MLKFIFVNETKSFANDTRARPAARPLVFENGTFYIIKPWQDLFVKLRFSLVKMPVAF
jgi:hypothetical protein